MWMPKKSYIFWDITIFPGSVLNIVACYDNHEEIKRLPSGGCVYTIICCSGMIELVFQS